MEPGSIHRFDVNLVINESLEIAACACEQVLDDYAGYSRESLGDLGIAVDVTAKRCASDIRGLKRPPVDMSKPPVCAIPQSRDAQALACITDEQAFESWERFKATRERYVAAVLELPQC